MAPGRSHPGLFLTHVAHSVQDQWATNSVDQSLATGGPGQHLLPGLEEATSDDKSPVLVFILTVIVTDPRSID